MEQYKHLQQKLEKEKDRLEAELGSVGRINPENPKDWEPTPETPIDKLPSADKADANILADAFEEFEGRSAVEVELENQLQDVLDALEKMKLGTYGSCELGEEAIEKERLEANPSARTCMRHMENEEG